jgi:hypothetical protein
MARCGGAEKFWSFVVKLPYFPPYPSFPPPRPLTINKHMKQPTAFLTADRFRRFRCWFECNMSCTAPSSTPPTR